MKSLRNDYCIRMFVANDQLRPALSKIQNFDKFIYATDAHVLARVADKLCVKKYDFHRDYPDVEMVLKKHVSAEKKTISVDQLFHELMEIEVCFKPIKVGCPKCSGEGQAHCSHCEYVNPCRDCRGEGVVDGPELEMSGEHNCTLFNRKYKLSFIDKIIKTAIILGVEEIEISNGKGISSIFQVGDFTILIVKVAEL